MSLAAKDLMARVMELESTTKRAETELQLERTQHSETRDHLTDAMNAFKCQVCITNEYDHVLVPCGHPICGMCLGQLAHPEQSEDMVPLRASQPIQRLPRKARFKLGQREASPKCVGCRCPMQSTARASGAGESRWRIYVRKNLEEKVAADVEQHAHRRR